MQEQDEMRKVETPEIMLTLIQQLNFEAGMKEKLLQQEESGNKIANLQGFLSGVRAYKQAMRDSGYILDEEFSSTERRLIPFLDNGVGTIELPELREVVYALNEITTSEDFEKFKDVWDEAIDEQKNWLFYISEKGRDLHFVKGWYEAMKWIDETIEELQEALVLKEKDEAESLPFDDGE
ncbi:hypothetical protein [Treponema denticola]|uniref:hypothetical protein n=1 Tax=Treponema denticola TaxID=158 RepID=UPI0002B52B37|nr:hypothetical protein [Treponema denticola]EMB44013.1 hypothetical protein HMPREF9730_01953 [Treponema denticola AL-2]